MEKCNDDYQTHCSYTDNASPDIISCPSCGAKGNYHGCGSYTRPLICYTSGQVERHEITVNRLECTSCGHSHAILAPVIIPYSPFSFHFIISLLYDFITHKFSSVKALCLEYDISVSTLYRIYHRFIEDRKLMLGMLEAASTQARTLLDKLANTDFYGIVDHLLHDFYRSNCASFLQARCRIRLNRDTLRTTPILPP
jgi:hypothetical protein